MAQPYFIFGAAGFAAEVSAWAKAERGESPAAFVVADGTSEKSPVRGVPVIAETQAFEEQGDAYIAIANPSIRKDLVTKVLQHARLSLPNLIHPSAFVDCSAELGTGNLILPFSVIGPNSSVGSFNILNLYCYVAHDCEIGDYNTMSPYSTFTGRSKCMEQCFLGAHATVGPSVCLFDGSRLSANSFARTDIEADALYSGVPAVRIDSAR